MIFSMRRALITSVVLVLAVGCVIWGKVLVDLAKSQSVKSVKAETQHADPKHPDQLHLDKTKTQKSPEKVTEPKNFEEVNIKADATESNTTPKPKPVTAPLVHQKPKDEEVKEEEEEEEEVPSKTSTEDELLEFPSKDTSDSETTTEGPDIVGTTLVAPKPHVTVSEGILHINGDELTSEVLNDCSNLDSFKIIAGKSASIDQWQKILNNDLAFVFSAYLEYRVKDRVWIHVFGAMAINMLKDNEKNQLYCQLWNADQELVAVVGGKIKVIAFVYRYESFLLECDFPSDTVITPEHSLSVTTEQCQIPNNVLTIHQNKIQVPQHKYTVCTSHSLKANYTDYQGLVEWIELNSILGVEKTVVYKSTVSKAVDLVLEYYSDKGLVDVLKWWPPSKLTRKLDYLAMINDCLFRYMGKTKYLAMLDVDEYFAPRSADNLKWDDMIASAGCEDRSYISALNTLFHTDWPDDEVFGKDKTAIFQKYGLMTLLKTRRETTFRQMRGGSKTIMRPENVDHVKMFSLVLRKHIDEDVCVIKPKYGALYHYRSPLYRVVKVTDESPEWTQDRTLHRYESQMMKRITKVYKDLTKMIPR